MSGLEGRHVIVTGASTGIGRATASLLARRGAKVFMVARNESRLQEAAGLIARAGGAAACAAADIADRSALTQAIDAAERRFGAIDGLFANAGTGGRFAPLGEYDDEVFESVIRTNLTSVFWAMKRILPGMIERRRGSILVTGHVMNHVSMHGWHRMIGIIARKIESGEFEKLMERIPLPDQRKKWKTARSGFSEADFANATEKIIYAVDKVEKQLAQTAWLAGNEYTLGDINFYSHCGMMVERMFPELKIAERCPRLVKWRDAVTARPAVAKALSGEDRTAPGLRTWTGHAR